MGSFGLPGRAYWFVLSSLFCRWQLENFKFLRRKYEHFVCAGLQGRQLVRIQREWLLSSKGVRRYAECTCINLCALAVNCSSLPASTRLVSMACVPRSKEFGIKQRYITLKPCSSYEGKDQRVSIYVDLRAIASLSGPCGDLTLQGSSILLICFGPDLDTPKRKSEDFNPHKYQWLAACCP